jgi:hypothetical protein
MQIDELDSSKTDPPVFLKLVTSNTTMDMTKFSIMK